MRKFALTVFTVLAVPAAAQPVVNPGNSHYAALAAPQPFIASGELTAKAAAAKAAWKGTLTPVPLVTAPPFRVFLEYRGDATPPSLHQKEAELVYVLDGAGTLVLGGNLTDPKPGPDGAITGSEVIGGETLLLTKGAYVFVPAGTPHHFTEVSPWNGLTVTTTFFPMPGQ